MSGICDRLDIDHFARLTSACRALAGLRSRASFWATSLLRRTRLRPNRALRFVLRRCSTSTPQLRTLAREIVRVLVEAYGADVSGGGDAAVDDRLESAGADYKSPLHLAVVGPSVDPSRGYWCPRFGDYLISADATSAEDSWAAQDCYCLDGEPYVYTASVFDQSTNEGQDAEDEFYTLEGKPTLHLGLDMDRRQCRLHHLPDPEMVRYLLQAGAVANRMSLLEAVEKDENVEISKVLIEYGALKTTTDRHYSASEFLTVAARRCAKEQVHLLLQSGARISPEYYYSYHEGTLIAAAHGGSAEVMKLLIDAGAPMRRHTNTALVDALVRGHRQVVRLMLEAGADPDDRHRFNYRQPVTAAAWRGDAEMVKLLVDHGADISLDSYDDYPGTLGIAAMHGHVDVIKVLLQSPTVRKEEATQVVENGVYDENTRSYVKVTDSVIKILEEFLAAAP
ncbi:hypothetical protein HK405_007483 [Cladochytrium tenue]|nr:hypothetical protein HK405_007483 [Cladochytrium tenue]